MYVCFLVGLMTWDCIFRHDIIKYLYIVRLMDGVTCAKTTDITSRSLVHLTKFRCVVIRDTISFLIDIKRKGTRMYMYMYTCT